MGLTGAIMGLSTSDGGDAGTTRRGSVVTAAKSRAMFENIDADAAKPKKSPKQEVLKAKFDNKRACAPTRVANHTRPQGTLRPQRTQVRVGTCGEIVSVVAICLVLKLLCAQAGATFEAGGPKAEGKRAVGAKAAMFEHAAEEAKPHDNEKKKTWTKGPGGSYKPHTKVGDGPVGKKTFGDLP
eukprot:7388093-Prymnesium_polylepis.1